MASAAPAQEDQETWEGKQFCPCGIVGGYLTRFERWSEKEMQYLLRYISKLHTRNSIACKENKLREKIF